MTLQELVEGIKDFGSWKHPEKILFFVWYLHVYGRRGRVQPSDIRSVYDSIHVEKPSSLNPFLDSLERSKPKRLLKDRQGYFLPRHIRENLDQEFGQRLATAQVHQLLADLPCKLPNLAERVFLEETLTCFRYKAFRASIVMCWNLAFDHLRDHVFTKCLGAFNTNASRVAPKRRLPAGVVTLDDFNEFKESEFLEICRAANVIDTNVHKILDEKLGRRNIAAHPSTVTITQLQAEDFITDLVTNVVLKFS